MSTNFYKGFGRIVVKDSGDAALVRTILRDLDRDEYDIYGDPDLVSTRPLHTYWGKFEFDIKELKTKCHKRGILIDVLDSQYDPDDPHSPCPHCGR